MMLTSHIEEVDDSRVSLEENTALRWAKLLCGLDHSAPLSPYDAGKRVLAWSARHCDMEPKLRDALHLLPEPFLTIRFHQEVRTLQTGLEQLKRTADCLRRDQVSLAQALTYLSQAFSGDEVRLVRWKKQTEGIPQLLFWLPNFERSFDYLSSAYVTPVQQLEEIRRDLFAAAAEPQRFLNASERAHFDHCVAAFKAGYIEYYCAAHENTANIVGNQEKMESRVDSLALRNLELLSDLEIADKRYLNRIRAVGKWVQAHQCDLPVQEILAHQPRCYCNFNPAAGLQLARSVHQMNADIHHGIDHIRAMLRKCKMLIIQELRNLGTDDLHARQIGSLLSPGPMIPLKQRSVDILNAIIQKHTEAFFSVRPSSLPSGRCPDQA